MPRPRSNGKAGSRPKSRKSHPKSIRKSLPKSNRKKNGLNFRVTNLPLPKNKATNYRENSFSRLSRPQEDIDNALREVQWNKGQDNSLAVIDAVKRATGFEMPAEDKYLKRLRLYEKQVLPMRYPTCPIGWSRHTKNPKAAEDVGVAWVDADGYFCGPPNSDPDTLYNEEDEEEETEAGLKKRIKELTTQIRHTLNPEEYQKEMENEEKMKEIKRDMYDTRARALKTAREKENEKKKKMHLDTLEKIFRPYEEDFEESAHTIYNQAVRCVDDDEANKEGCTKVTSAGNTFYVPNVLIRLDEGPATEFALGWWREFRRESIANMSNKNMKYM